MTKKILMLFFITLLCISCPQDNTQYKGVSFFTKDIDLTAPLENRIQIASNDVISWLISFEIADSYQPYMPSDGEKELFTAYLNLLPQKYRQIMEEKIISIFFIENFEGSGMTMFDFDKKGNMFIVLFLNPEILRHTITEWINTRENSYFNVNSSIAIAAECSGDYLALIFALLHEASHIYDYYYHITPYTEPGLQDKHSPVKTDFTDAVWLDHSQPVKEYDFPLRTELYAWGLGPVQDRSHAMDIYRFLSKTPFASLYASQNWAEDFAESFTWFYLDKYLNCSYQVKVSRNNGSAEASQTEKTFFYEPVKNLMLTMRFGVFTTICN